MPYPNKLLTLRPENVLFEHDSVKEHWPNASSLSCCITGMLHYWQTGGHVFSSAGLPVLLSHSDTTLSQICWKKTSLNHYVDCWQAIKWISGRQCDCHQYWLLVLPWVHLTPYLGVGMRQCVPFHHFSVHLNSKFNLAMLVNLPLTANQRLKPPSLLQCNLSGVPLCCCSVI